MKLRDALFALPLFLLVYGVYATSPVTQSTDSRYSLHLVKSIITEHNLNMDEYAQLIPSDDYRIEWINGHSYPWHPIGTPLMAVPFMALCNVVDPRCLGDIEAIYARAEIYIASFYSALVVVLIYFIGRFSLSETKSVVLALVIAFATSLWSVASRALHQHAPSMFLLCGALLLLLAARRRPWLVLFAGVPLALSYWVRPTNSISIALLTLYVLLEYRRYIFGYVLGAALITAPFLIVNLNIYGSLLSPYYHTANQIGDLRDFFEALAGNLIGPARGLFIFSPILLLSGFGVFFKAKQGGLSRLDYALLLVIGLHWVTLASHQPWWAGWAYGPRFFADMLPYFAFFLIPVVDTVTNSKTAPLSVTFAALLLVSMFIHYWGATAQVTFDWNSIPTNVDYQYSRVWDWRDPQFLRGSAQFDRLMPQSIEIVPTRLLARFQPGQSGFQPVPITIYLSRGARFDWKAETGAGITLTPDHGENVTKAAPLIAVAATKPFSGTDQPDGIRIFARPSNDSAAEWQSVSVPILYTCYLPSVFSSTR
jgi:hypothetical protein